MAAPTFVRQPDGTLIQTVNGVSTPVIDPDGSYERSFAAPQPMASAQPANGLPTNPQIMDPSQMSGAQQGTLHGVPGAGAVAPAPLEQQFGSAIGLPQRPHATLVAQPGHEAAMARAPDPVAVPGGTGAMGKETSKESTSHGTEGFAAPDKAALTANAEQANRSAQGAVNAAEQGNAARIQTESGAANRAYFEGKAKEAGAMAAQQHYAQVYDESLQQSAAARKKPINPGEAFADNKGAYAFAATMGSALANVGRAWMGQAMQPITVIDDLVNRSIKLQMDRRQQLVDTASDSAGAAHEAMLDAKARAHEGAAQAADAQLAFAKTKAEADMARSIAADQRAKADAANFDKAKSVATRSTSQHVQENTAAAQPGAAGGGLAIPGSQQSAENQRVINDELARAYPTLKPEERQKQWDEFQAKSAALDGMRKKIADVRRMLKTSGAAGEGRIGSHVPDSMTTDAGSAVRSSLSDIVQGVPALRGQTKAPSETEMAKLEHILLGNHSPESIEHGLAGVEAELNSHDRERRAHAPALARADDWMRQRQNDQARAGTSGLDQQNAAVR